MCDPVLVGAILEELGYFNKKKEMERKDQADDEETKKSKSRNSGTRKKVAHKCQFACLAPSFLSPDIF